MRTVPTVVISMRTNIAHKETSHILCLLPKLNMPHGGRYAAASTDSNEPSKSVVLAFNGNEAVYNCP